MRQVEVPRWDLPLKQVKLILNGNLRTIQTHENLVCGGTNGSSKQIQTQGMKTWCAEEQ